MLNIAHLPYCWIMHRSWISSITRYNFCVRIWNLKQYNSTFQRNSYVSIYKHDIYGMFSFPVHIYKGRMVLICHRWCNYVDMSPVNHTHYSTTFPFLKKSIKKIIFLQINVIIIMTIMFASVLLHLFLPEKWEILSTVGTNVLILMNRSHVCIC